MKAGTRRIKDNTAPPRISNNPVICKNASVGSTGNLFPARIKGVAKSAKEAAKSNKKEFAKPGTVRGRVTVLKTLPRELPKLKAISSTVGSMPPMIAFKVR